MSKKKPSKQVKRKVNPDTTKHAKIQPGVDPDSPQYYYPSWQFATMDINGPWCPKKIRSFWGKIHPKLKNLESMTWTKIQQGTGSHYISVGDIIPEAYRRLSEINLEDTDELFSLRMQGEHRLWGLLSSGIFRILWWDPEHEICPSTKKHT